MFYFYNDWANALRSIGDKYNYARSILMARTHTNGLTFWYKDRSIARVTPNEIYILNPREHATVARAKWIGAFIIDVFHQDNKACPDFDIKVSKKQLVWVTEDKRTLVQDSDYVSEDGVIHMFYREPSKRVLQIKKQLQAVQMELMSALEEEKKATDGNIPARV